MLANPSLLRAFRHPAVVASILLLLLNDHVLKASFHSALTGVLSDFAGLLFFPFLLGILLQGLARLAGRRLGPWPALLAGFIITGVVFAAIKTLPAANACAASLASSILGRPAGFALDPGDLLALAAFLPAWLVWRGIERGSQPQNAPGRLAYAALALGALASLATPPCQTVYSVRHLALAGDMLYAGSGSSVPGGFTSQDLGVTWTWGELPPDLQALLSQPVSLPLTLCDPASQRTCYRIDGRPQVEESLDGGSTWSVAWQLPTGRQGYMVRAARGTIPLGCGKIPDFHTYDMLFLLGPRGLRLAVAMGNEGLLVYSTPNGWQRQGIEIYYNGYLQPVSPSPTPYAAATFNKALQDTTPEWWLFLAAGILVYTGLSLWGWVFAARHRSPDAEQTAGWIFRPLRGLGIWILFLVAAWLLLNLLPPETRNNFMPLLILGSLALPPMVLVLSLVLWGRASRLMARPGPFKWAGWVALLAGIAIFGVTWAFLLLWAFGLVVTYGLALALSILGGVAVLAGGIAWMRRAMRKALPEQDLNR